MNYLNNFCKQVRRDIVRMVYEAKSGHPGGSLGCVEFMSILYKEFLSYDSQKFNMDGIGEDVFILSNGHISPVLYSVLSRVGYFNTTELKTFRKINSRLQGHPSVSKGLPGVRISSGSLGQGMSVSIGAAISKKLNNDNKTVFSLHGDGELQEGQIWEAAMYAGAKKVDNYIATIDINGNQIDGKTEDVMDLGSIKDKFISFGWQTLDINDGNCLKEVFEKISEAKKLTSKNKPICILMNTVMGKGVSYMEDKHNWHGIAPNKEQLEIALSEIEETLGDY